MTEARSASDEAGAEAATSSAGEAGVTAASFASGGSGETCHSYVDESFAGVGRSTPSQTAWAVLSLQSSGLAAHPACRAGLDFLRERQAEGTWVEPEFTGTGFPGDFYINYHLYRHVFPTMALAGERSGGA